MAAQSGMIGAVAVASGYVLNAYNWKMDIEQQTLESTAFAPTSNYRTYIPGLISWSGSYEARLDGTTTTGLPILTAAATCSFTAFTGRVYSGTIVQKMTGVSCAFDGVNTVTLSYQGSGLLTVA